MMWFIVREIKIVDCNLKYIKMYLKEVYKYIGFSLVVIYFVFYKFYRF